MFPLRKIRTFALVSHLAVAFGGWRISLCQEPVWLPPIANGGAPECPEHDGLRSLRSEIVQHKLVTAFISGTTVRAAKRCGATADLQITNDGKMQRLELPAPGETSYSIVDFSPDGSQIFLSSVLRGEEKYQHRDVSISEIKLADGTLQWHNAWDLFGWGDCDAMVEPQGFLSDGRLVISARKSVIYAQPRPNCVDDVGLYAVDLAARGAIRLPDSTKIERYGNVQRQAFEACKSDPDIVAACFAFHGRLDLYNGTPTARIWRIGTHRILGVEDDFPVPEPLSGKVDWDLDTYANFVVCPFARSKAGSMQSVCIESVKDIVVQKRN